MTLDGRPVHANPALAQLNGYDTEEEFLAVVGDVGDGWYVEPGRRTSFLHELNKDGSVTNFESEIRRHKTGEHLWVSENAWLVRAGDGEVAYYEGTVQDISERKLAESALIESEGRFKDFADTAADWFWEMGSDLRFTYLSKRVEIVVGVPVEFHIGKTREELAGESAADENWLHHLDDLREHKPFRNFTYLRKGHDDRLQYISTSGKPVFDDDGLFMGYRGSARDVTASAEWERGRSEFISTVSHELRTPLTSIFGALGLVSGGAAGPVPQRLRPMLDMAYNNSNRLVRLINDVLDIEKFEAGKMEFDMRPIEAIALVEEGLEANKGFADEQGVDFILKEALPGTRVLGDYDRLMQVMANLLSNAVKYSPQGDTVEIAVTCCERFLRVEIHDNGPGIPAQYRESVFEKFSQVDATDSRNASGTGLGLSICKAIVAKHGGDIGVDEGTRNGTTLYFTLPELSLTKDAWEADSQ